MKKHIELIPYMTVVGKCSTQNTNRAMSLIYMTDKDSSLAYMTGIIRYKFGKHYRQSHMFG